MSADDIDIDDPSEDEDVVDEDEPIEDLEPNADDLAESTVTPEPGLENVESIQDILAKQESQEEQVAAAEEEDDAALAAMVRDERLEPTESRVVPIQETEFTCKRCFLVKHRSQLADKKKMLCRDCA
ncbi:MAG: DUF4193 family protein [Actinomycetota bacterium]